jgi:hypothetical protein
VLHPLCRRRQRCSATGSRRCLPRCDRLSCFVLHGLHHDVRACRRLVVVVVVVVVMMMMMMCSPVQFTLKKGGEATEHLP